MQIWWGKMQFEDLTEKVIGCAIEVHRVLGPGLLESAYEQCLAHELNLANIPFKSQISIPVEYKGIRLDCAYRLDFLVAEKILVELKSVDNISGIYEAQLLTYMKLAKVEVGLLINFNVEVLHKGLKRFVL
jgi:GxxExxY protein